MGSLHAEIREGGGTPWEPFRERFKSYTFKHPQDVAPLTGKDLKRAIRKWKLASAMGADGWRVPELRALPEWLLDQLAIVLNIIEETGS